MPGEITVGAAYKATTKINNPANEIKIGEELLEYASELGSLLETVQSAYTYAIQCRTNVQEEDTYKGEAAEEMEAFFMSLEAHLQKMIFLYQAAITYVNKVYVEFYYNEQQLIDWAKNEIWGESSNG